MISDIGSSWSPGHYAAVICFSLAGLALLIGAVLIWLGVGDHYSDKPTWGWLLIGHTVVGVVIGVLAYWPFSADFHKYYPVTGTVQTVDSRLIGNGDSGVSQRFVVVLKESGQPFAIDDTRATLLKPGDSVNLRCKREFEFNSVPGWGCKWNAAY